MNMHIIYDYAYMIMLLILYWLTIDDEKVPSNCTVFKEIKSEDLLETKL